MKRIRFGLAALALTAAVMAAITVAMVRQARAEVILNEDFPISGLLVTPCNGELVQYSGSLHETIHVTANNNTFHIGEHVNAQDVSGVGLTTGAQYRISDSFNISENLAAGETFTQGENFHVIGQGQTPNFVLHTLFHITVDANGNVTSFVDNFTTDCH